MIDSALISFTYFTLSLCALAVAYLLIGATLYDIRMILLTRKQTLIKKKLQRFRPPVSVIIVSHNSQQYIVDCLDSIISGSYKKYQVIVADLASTDATKSLVRGYITKYPKQNIRLVAKRKKSDFAETVRQTTKTHASNTLILPLYANQTVQKDTLKHASAHFYNPQLKELKFNLHTVPDLKISDFACSLISCIYYYARKSLYPLRSNTIGSASLYDRSYLLSRTPLVTKRSRLYASDLAVIQKPGNLHSDRQISTKLRLVRALSTTSLLVSLGYIVYLSATDKNTTLFIATFGLGLAWLALIIWTNESFSIHEKCKLSFLIPISPAMFLMYIASPKRT